MGADGGARRVADVGAQEGWGHGGKGGGLQGGGEDLMCGSCSAKASGIKVHFVAFVSTVFYVCMGSAPYIRYSILPMMCTIKCACAMYFNVNVISWWLFYMLIVPCWQCGHVASSYRFFLIVITMTHHHDRASYNCTVQAVCIGYLSSL